jgi:hypothetical protein
VPSGIVVIGSLIALVWDPDAAEAADARRCPQPLPLPLGVDAAA